MKRINTTQYLLRFDDICPTMNWRVWAEIEPILVERGIKPLLAVVPDNQDPVLQADPPAGDFWDRARAWQERGWTIALHGYQHRYVSRNAGLVATRKKSEFAGLPAGEQREKLRRGVEIFKREGITPRVWIAPGHTFDAATIALLPEVGIRIINDGYFRFPFVCPPTSSNGERLKEKGWMTWVPQQLSYFRPAPSGVWTVCYHPNAWDSARLQKFRGDLDHYHANIVSLEDVVDGSTPREGKWSAWLCTHPRLSEFLIRAELKLWAVTGGGWRGMRARKEPACHASRVTLQGKSKRTSRHPSPVTRHLKELCAELQVFLRLRGIAAWTNARKSPGGWLPLWRIAGPTTKGRGPMPKPAWRWGIGVCQFWT